jgi:hypothetical protein
MSTQHTYCTVTADEAARICASRPPAPLPDFQSAEHARSYRNACRALASARRDAYRAASAMTDADLRECEPAYRALVPGPVSGEALLQLRMVRAILARRAQSPRSRSREAARYRAARRSVRG